MITLRDGICVETVGRLEENCYLVAPKGGDFLYIIDPGDDAETIYEAASQFKRAHALLLLTHAHVDHISALGELSKKLGLKTVVMHPDDQKLYRSPNNHLMPFMAVSVDLPDTVWPPEPNADFQWYHTPGHTRGGVCYHFPKLNALFTGDTLFHASVGRTDLPGGDHTALFNSIRNVLFKLPDATEIFPGHGDSSTLGDEKATNPYVSL